MPTLNLVFTGMVAFSPGYKEKSVKRLTFVLLENHHARPSQYNGDRIPVHFPFVAVQEDNLANPKPSRAFDVAPNDNGYGVWLLDKEGLHIGDSPTTGVTFESNVEHNIAPSAEICSYLPTNKGFFKGKVKPTSPVGARFTLTTGRAKATGELNAVEFSSSCGRSPKPWKGEISNELTVSLNLQGPLVTLSSTSLVGKSPFPNGANDLLLTFDNGKDMTVYVGSGSISALAGLGDPPKSPKRLGLARSVRHPEVHFELFYDVAKSKKPPLPIPIYQGGSGPVAGTDHCPPKQG